MAKLTARQMVNQMKKKQDIVIADKGTWTTWLLIGYQAAISGIEVKATLIRYEDGKEVERCPKSTRVLTM